MLPLTCTSSLVTSFIDEYLSIILGTLMKMHMVRNSLALLLCTCVDALSALLTRV